MISLGEIMKRAALLDIIERFTINGHFTRKNHDRSPELIMFEKQDMEIELYRTIGENMKRHETINGGAPRNNHEQ